MNIDPQYLQDETDRPNIQLEVGLKAQNLYQWNYKLCNKLTQSLARKSGREGLLIP